MARFDYRQTETLATPGGRWRQWLYERPQMPYILPFFVFVLVMLPSAFGHVGGMDWEKLWHDWLPALYPLKTVLAALLLWYFWPWYTRIFWGKLGLGVIFGLVGTVLWIGTELLCQKLGLSVKPDAASLYNPDVMLGGGWKEWLFLCVRVAGPALVVPIMEELFFRDFLMRALVRGSRYDEVPVGTFTWLSLLGMSVLFGLNHGRMFVAGVAYGLLMGVLVIRTKSLGACIVAHGVTNWTLYLYVIYAGDWQFM